MSTHPILIITSPARWVPPGCRPLLLGLVFLSLVSAARAESITKSKHNLSVSGPGQIKAVTESEICVFCHTSHSASPEAPLWNRFDSGAAYAPYTSSTRKARPGQPSGPSKLCLSCHDGTVAPGMLRSRKKEVQFRGVELIGGSKGTLGRDLSDDHPVSIRYDSALASQNGQLNNPSTLLAKVRLVDSQVECTSCHDPHNNEFGKFLVVNNSGSALCLNCHNQTYWNSSSHKTAISTWNGVEPNPWPHTDRKTVADNGCENCHTPHNAGKSERLLNYNRDEDNCYSCHNGNVAAKNIQAEFNKPYTHPIRDSSGRHDPKENPINPVRHVTCADCHNPHAFESKAPVTAAAGLPVPATQAKVKGVNEMGTVVDTISGQHQLCYRCHADSVARGRAKIPRNEIQTNTRLDFDAANASFHPIHAVGKNLNVPSLIWPWQTSSFMTCTDCHSNDDGPGAGGSGPAGPHGSSYPVLMERALVFTDFQPESAENYALCYKCHDRSSILSDQSFPLHRKHVVDAKTSCTTCHDPHGSASTPHLINFNTTYVTKPANGRLAFTDNGTFHGSCTLSCHGREHNPLSY